MCYNVYIMYNMISMLNMKDMLNYFPLWTWTRIVFSISIYSEHIFWAPTICPFWFWDYHARFGACPLGWVAIDRGHQLPISLPIPLPWSSLPLFVFLTLFVWVSQWCDWFGSHSKMATSWNYYLPSWISRSLCQDNLLCIYKVAIYLR